MNWGNAIIKTIHHSSGDSSGSGMVTAIDAELHLEGSVKLTKWKLTWLADVPDLVPLRLVELGHLITKPKVRNLMLLQGQCDALFMNKWSHTTARRADCSTAGLSAPRNASQSESVCASDVAMLQWCNNVHAGMRYADALSDRVHLALLVP